MFPRAKIKMKVVKVLNAGNSFHWSIIFQQSRSALMNLPYLGMSLKFVVQ